MSPSLHFIFPSFFFFFFVQTLSFLCRRGRFWDLLSRLLGWGRLGLDDGLGVWGLLLRGGDLGDDPGFEVEPVEKHKDVEDGQEDEPHNEEDLEEGCLKVLPEGGDQAAKIGLIATLAEPPDGAMHVEDSPPLGFLKGIADRVRGGAHDEAIVNMKDVVHVVVDVNVSGLDKSPDGDGEGHEA